jgi:predicted nucleic acid-binding Zn ribbon protein
MKNFPIKLNKVELTGEEFDKVLKAFERIDDLTESIEVTRKALNKFQDKLIEAGIIFKGSFNDIIESDITLEVRTAHTASGPQIEIGVF